MILIHQKDKKETMSSVNKQYSLTQKVLSEQAQMGTIQAQIAQHDPNVGKKVCSN